jgi:hypothetical protein
MTGRAAIVALLLFSLPLGAAVSVVSTTQLQGELADALDVRWSAERELVLALGKKGLARYDVDTRESRRIVNGSRRDGFFYAARLGLSRGYIVPGSSFAALAWMRNAPGAALSPQIPFDMIVDLDVYGDQLAVLGARRADDGRWAPEGAIVWVGTLSKGLSDLRPLHYSETGSGAKALDRCHYFNTGTVRYMRDGSLVVIPAIEAGVFVYDLSGKLLQTWDDDPIGFQHRCELSQQQAYDLAIRPTEQWQWLNARTILDDVIPLPNGIGVFTRKFSGGAMHWTLSVLRNGKVAQRIPLPFTGGERSFVRADVRGKQIALLLIEYATQKTPDGARLAIMELQ